MPQQQQQQQQQRPDVTSSIFDLSRQQNHHKQIQRAYAEATEQLRGYGFTDETAIAKVLRQTGPSNIKTAIRLLMQLEREASFSSSGASNAESEEESTNDSTCENNSSLNTTIDSEVSMHAEMQDDDEVMDEDVDADEESLSSEDTAEVNRCRAKTEAIEREAMEYQNEYEPLVLKQQWRKCKMLRGVPVDLLTYEEALLRLQMGLDAIVVRVDAVSEAVRVEVRGLRRKAVKDIQERLDRIDVTRHWWLENKEEDECQTELTKGLAPAAVEVA